MISKFLQHIFFLGFITLSLTVNAQDKNRIEYEVDEQSTFETVPLGKRGALVFYDTQDKSDKAMTTYKIDKYDIGMSKISTSTLKVKKKFDFLEKVNDPTGLYLLFANAAVVSRSVTLNAPTFTEFTIYKLDSNGNTTTYNGVLPKDIHYKKMVVVNGVVYVGGSIGPTASTIQTRMCISMCFCFIPMLFFNNNHIPFVFSVDMNSQRPTKKDFNIQSDIKMNTVVKDMDGNSEEGECTFLVSSNSKKNSSSYIKVIKDGKLEKDLNTKFPGDKSISNIHINSLGSQRVLFGTYSAATGNNAMLAQNTIGIFFSTFENGARTAFSTIPYSSFKNFHIYLTKSEARSTKKDSKKGKETTISMNVNFHDIIIRDNEYIIMGESYYPQYHTEVTTTYNANGTVSYQTRTVFDGYRFYGAFVCAVDKQGKLIWDNGLSFDMSKSDNVSKQGILSYSLDKKFRFIEGNDESITIIINDGVNIKTASVDKDGALTLNKDKKISTGSKSDKSVTNLDDNGQLDYWYDNYFLASGLQKIRTESMAQVKSKNKGEKKKRTVYYINKIEIQ